LAVSAGAEIPPTPFFKEGGVGNGVEYDGDEMKHRGMTFLVWVLIFFVSGWFVFRTRDITKSVGDLEKSVLGVLSDFGVSNRDIFSRKEIKWKRPRLRGETLHYVFKLRKKASASRLLEAVEDGLKNDKKFRFSESLFYFDRNTPVANFEISYKDKPVFHAEVKNVMPDWMEEVAKAAGKESPKRQGSVKAVERTEPSKLALPKKKSAIVALVLDDFGYSKKNLDALKDLKTPITFAVLPNAPYTEKVCSFAKKNGFEVIIHLPMEPEKQKESLERNTVTCDMTNAEIKRKVRDALKSVPLAKGMSNHMGSKATCDERLMTVVCKLLKKKNMFFLDSFTTEKSVSEQVAEKEGVFCIKRDIFIDHNSSLEDIKERMNELEEMAFDKGYVIAIGHDRSLTVKVLEETIPNMKADGIKFVNLTEMVKLKTKDKKK